MHTTSTPVLAELAISDDPDAWRALGFRVDTDGNLDLGSVRVRLGAAEDEFGTSALDARGLVSWSLTGVNALGQIDGLNTPVPHILRPPPFETHPNGATGLDHVVIITGDFDRTANAFARAGIALKRTVESDRGRMGFRRIGPAILELVQRPELDSEQARFWGITIVVVSLEDLADRLGDKLGPIRDAVQPRRRIATLQRSAGVSLPVAFMSPELL